MSITVVLFSRDKGKYVEIKEREMKVKKKKKKKNRETRMSSRMSKLLKCNIRENRNVSALVP